MAGLPLYYAFFGAQSPVSIKAPGNIELENKPDKELWPHLTDLFVLCRTNYSWGSVVFFPSGGFSGFLRHCQQSSWK